MLFEHCFYSACVLHDLFSYFMSDGEIFWEAHYLSKCYQNEYEQHVICHSAIQSSTEPIFFNAEKKVPKINQYICPSSICLSDMITFSMISLIMFSIKDFFVL